MGLQQKTKGPMKSLVTAFPKKHVDVPAISCVH